MQEKYIEDAKIIVKIYLLKRKILLQIMKKIIILTKIKKTKIKEKNDELLRCNGW